MSFTYSRWNLLDAPAINLVNISEEKIKERYTNLLLDVRTTSKNNISFNYKIPFVVVNTKKAIIDDNGNVDTIEVEDKGFTDLEFTFIYNLNGIKLYNSLSIPMDYQTQRTSPWLGAGTIKYGNKIELNYFKALGIIGIGTGFEYNFNVHLNNSRVKRGNYNNSVKIYTAAIYKKLNFGITAAYRFKKSNYDQLIPVIIPQNVKKDTLYSIKNWEPNVNAFIFIDSIIYKDSIVYTDTILFENTLGHQVLQIQSDNDPNAFEYPEIIVPGYGNLVKEASYGVGIFAGNQINEFVDIFIGYNGGFGIKNAPKSWSWWLQLKYKL